jgi:predicted Zn finger-like uncharacterized protein
VIVVCQKCSTRFQLDEARIPAKGARVRCSRCKHAFLVAPPVPDDQTIHRIAERAAAGKRGEGGRHFQKPGESDEDDWQFNLDPPEEGAGPPSARAPIPPPAEITDSEPTESESVESYFEFDGLADPDPPAPAPASAPAPAARAPAPKRIEPEQQVDFENLGNPESWEFGRRAPVVAPAKARKKAAARAPVATPAAEARAPERIAPAAPRRRPSRVGSLAGAAAWLLALALFAFGLRGVWVVPAAPALSADVAAVGPLELRGLRVRHLENLWSGPLVVVAGELRNPGSAPARAGAAARLRVLDAQGAELPAAAWFGPALPDGELRALRPELLVDNLERAAPSLADTSLAPNERFEVQALLTALPPEASGLRVEPEDVVAPAAPPPPAALDAPPAPDGGGDLGATEADAAED